MWGEIEKLWSIEKLEKLRNCRNCGQIFILGMPSEGQRKLTGGSPVMPACGRQGRSQSHGAWMALAER